MEYLSSIDDALESISEEGIVYYDLFDFPELFFGNLNFANDSLNFSKFPTSLISGVVYPSDFNRFSSGIRLRFKTLSSRIIFKIELSEYEYNDINIKYGRSFDIYTLNYDEYIPLKVLTPRKDEKIFAEYVYVDENMGICVFLPIFSKINKIYIGLEENTTLTPAEYYGENKLPILFYGNINTIEETASKSGNTYPNLISKKLDQDIITLTLPSTIISDEIATYIGKINCYSIILDLNIPQNSEYRKKDFENFYKKIRQTHPHTKIILLTSTDTSANKRNKTYDKIIYEIYEKTKKKDEKTFLIDRSKLYSKYDNDEKMNTLAKEICNIFKRK